MAITITPETAGLLREIDALRDQLEERVPIAKQRLSQELQPMIDRLRTLLRDMVYTPKVVDDLIDKRHQATIRLDDVLYARLSMIYSLFCSTPPRDFNARLVIELSEADSGDGTIELELTVKLVTSLIGVKARQQIDGEAGKIAQELATAFETAVEYSSIVCFAPEPSPDSE